MFRSRLLAGALVAAGVVGVGVAAAAVGGGGESELADPTTTTVATTTTSTTTTVPTIVTEPDTAETLTEEAGVERSTEGCGGETYKNHGEFVSSVARDPDRQPGDVVAAAQSDCGKPLHATADDPPEGEDDDPTESADSSDSESGPRPAGPPFGKGKGNGPK